MYRNLGRSPNQCDILVLSRSLRRNRIQKLSQTAGHVLAGTHLVTDHPNDRIHSVVLRVYADIRDTAQSTNGFERCLLYAQRVLGAGGIHGNY